VFTGIVQGRATVAGVTDTDGVRALTLQFPPGALTGLTIGASIAVDGVCLTAVASDADQARFDVIDETLALTTLGALAPDHVVNFERAAAFGDEIGGHLLSGHVVATVEVVARTERDANLELVLRVPADHLKHVLPKGYVALDGISLTIGRVEGDTFSVHLIPETRRVTTLDAKRPGDRINLEVDAMTQAVVATVERVLAQRSA
jgi:riboflavin synthase